ncbi:MAG TPA: hypothetical protein VGI54_07445, partial [Solirubrobacteraceae bacterium]
MKARSRYELNVTRGGRGPAFLAERDRLDRVEVVSLDEGEAIFVWDLPPRRARRLVAALREDLGAMEEAEFVAAWRPAAEQGRE